uniref:Uncharacterized protein n=1 Tax=Ananas comosus var. bracteatus TaxID=296719 RepID=A0A6V7NSL8_ANACO|nr:unnamed protein product [Ananas comosus var. bracteatus]
MAYNPDGVVDFEAHLDLADLAYTKFICRFADLDSATQFNTFGLALGCPEPLTPGQPSDFSNYFKVFYEKDFRLHVLRSWFGERTTGPSWLLIRYEAIKDQLASSRASEYADVWFSILATRDLHVGLKNRSKLTPSTEVILLTMWRVNLVWFRGFRLHLNSSRPILLTTILLQKATLKPIAFQHWKIVLDDFFKLVCFQPNHARVLDFRFTRSWNTFCQQHFYNIMTSLFAKIFHTECILSFD